MLDMTHSSRRSTAFSDTVTVRERGPSLEELVLDYLQAEFAGVIRSHTRGEVYGGR